MILPILALLGDCMGINVLPRFDAMTDEEIFYYNMDKSGMQQVVCEDTNRIGSYIRRRRCMTVDQIIREKMATSLRLGF